MYSFLNKFAAPFPPHLNNVSTLPCEIWKCSSHTCYWRVVRQSNFKICPTSTVASKFARFESSWLQRVMQLWHDAGCSVAHSVLIRCFSSSRSTMSILNTSCNIPHTL